MVANASEETFQDILKVVTSHGAKWTISRQGTCYCRKEYLTQEAKVWFYFIQTSIFLAFLSCTISITQIILLYCILTEMSINMGRIILNEVQKCAKKKRQVVATFHHSSL